MSKIYSLTSCSIYLDASQSCIRNLVCEGNFILSVEVIPQINPTISSSNKEQTSSGGRPGTIRQVSTVISGSDNRGLDIFIPDLFKKNKEPSITHFHLFPHYLNRPITNRHEEFIVDGISLKSSDGTIMSSIINTNSGIGINISLRSLVNSQDGALLSTNQIFSRLRETNKD